MGGRSRQSCGACGASRALRARGYSEGTRVVASARGVTAELLSLATVNRARVEFPRFR